MLRIFSLRSPPPRVGYPRRHHHTRRPGPPSKPRDSASAPRGGSPSPEMERCCSRAGASRNRFYELPKKGVRYGREIMACNVTDVVSRAISNLSPFGRCILSPNPVSLGVVKFGSGTLRPNPVSLRVAKFGNGTLRSGYATVTAKSGKSVGGFQIW